MQNITQSTSSYLLAAPLEILHKENLEFMEEIEFWKGEVKFFKTLIRTAARKHLPQMHTDEARKIEKHLIFVSAEKLNDLQNEAIAHEHFLATNIAKLAVEESHYRLLHKEIAQKFRDFEKEFKELKQDIFNLVEEIEPPVAQ